jgi:hypothetical protein
MKLSIRQFSLSSCYFLSRMSKHFPLALFPKPCNHIVLSALETKLHTIEN